MRKALIASLASILALAACGDDGGSTPAVDAATASVVKVACPGATISATVTAPGFMFMPEDSTVAAGQIVKFTMPGEHNAQSDTAGLFRADFAGDSCFRFDVAGTYGFHCVPHSFTGSIVVQ